MGLFVFREVGLAASASSTSLGSLYWELSVVTDKISAERDALAAGKVAGAAFDRGLDADNAGKKGAREWVVSLTKDLQERRADIQREVKAGLLDERGAAQAGRQVAAQFTRELSGGLRALREKGVIGVNDLPALLSTGGAALKTHTLEVGRLATQLNSVDKATTVAGGALLKFRGPLTQLATSAIGVRSNVGQLASQLALLGFGSTLTIGITAGIAAIAFAYGKITEAARESRKRIDDVIDGLRKQREEQFKTSEAGLRSTLAIAQSEQRAAERRVTTALTPTVAVTNPTTGIKTEGGFVNQDAVTKSLKESFEAALNTRQAEENLAALRATSAERQAAGLGSALQAGKASNKITAEAIALTQKYNAELNSLLGSGKTDQASLDRIRTLKSMIDDLTAADRAKEKADVRAGKAGDRAAQARANARQAFDSAIAAKTPQKEDDLEQQIARLTKSATDAKLPVSEITAKVSALRAAFAENEKLKQAGLANELRTLTAQSTITAVDDLTNALNEQIKAFREKGATTEQIDQLDQLGNAMIDATARAEALQAALDEIKQDTAQGFNLTGNLEKLQPLIAKAQAARDAAPKGTDVQKSAQNDLNEALREEANIRKQIKDIQDGVTAKTKTASQNAAALAGDIANAANAAFGLASAFLGVDSNITKALGSIGQLAGGIQSALGATSLLSALPGIGQAIGGGLALAKSIGGALGIGESPEEKARAQRVTENTEALRHLSTRIGDLGKNITGADILRVGSAVNNPNLNGLTSTDALSRKLGANLTALGLSFKDLAALAKELGISIDETRIQFKDVQAIQKALRDAELGKFADTFAGQLAQMEAEANAFDITSPIAKFNALKKALGGVKDGAGIVGETLAGFDVSTSEGIAAAIKALQGLFTDITNGNVDPSKFGGLTGQDTIDAILKALDILKTGQAASGTGGFNTVQSITEATGGRLIAAFTTGNIFAGQTAANTAEIVRRLGGVVPAVGPISAPPASTSGGGGSSGGSISLTVNVTVNGGGADAEQTGHRIGIATAREINKSLGGLVKWGRRSVGDPVRN